MPKTLGSKAKQAVAAALAVPGTRIILWAGSCKLARREAERILAFTANSVRRGQWAVEFPNGSQIEVRVAGWEPPRRPYYGRP